MDNKMVVIIQDGRCVFASVPMSESSAHDLVLIIGEGEVVDVEVGREWKRKMMAA